MSAATRLAYGCLITACIALPAFVAGLVARVSDCPACRTWHWPAITLVVIYGPVALLFVWLLALTVVVRA